MDSMQGQLRTNSRRLVPKENIKVNIDSAKLNSVGGFLLPAVVLGYAELLVGSKELDLLLNGIVSSISGINTSTAVVEEGLQKLTTLNTLCEVDDMCWSRVKEFRIVMLLKTVLNWWSVVKDSHESWVISTEVLQLMKSLFPWIKHIDGDFWARGMTLLKEALDVIPALIILTI
jgi:hypothetical protein